MCIKKKSLNSRHGLRETTLFLEIEIHDSLPCHFVVSMAVCLKTVQRKTHETTIKSFTALNLNATVFSL